MSHKVTSWWLHEVGDNGSLEKLYPATPLLSKRNGTEKGIVTPMAHQLQ